MTDGIASSSSISSLSRQTYVSQSGKRHDLSAGAVIITPSIDERSYTMFWTFLLVVAFSAVLIKLGATTVMVSVISLGLKSALIVIAILATLLLWKQFSKRANQSME
jgi:hypothetical protein